MLLGLVALRVVPSAGQVWSLGAAGRCCQNVSSIKDISVCPNVFKGSRVVVGFKAMVLPLQPCTSPHFLQNVLPFRFLRYFPKWDMPPAVPSMWWALPIILYPAAEATLVNTTLQSQLRVYVEYRSCCRAGLAPGWDSETWLIPSQRCRKAQRWRNLIQQNMHLVIFNHSNYIFQQVFV